MDQKQQLLSTIEKNIQQYSDQYHNYSFDPSRPIVRLHEPSFGAGEIYAATETLLSTFVTIGDKVKAFEERYCQHLGYQHGISNNSGSSANLLAVAALTNPLTPDHFQPGDEIIVPALAWSTTIWPLVQHNLTPVFVDCDINSYNLDIEKVEAAITNKTRGIMPIHVYGNPCNMDQLMALANQHNLVVIEDCCEAMGATYDNKAVGSFGRIGTFSFYYSHHITTLEGGICVTDERELADMMSILRSHGWTRQLDDKAKYESLYPELDPRFIFVNQGYNLRITEVQAAMGLIQIPKLTQFVQNRRETAAYYLQAFNQYQDFFTFQSETPNSCHSWFGFPFVIKETAPFSVKDITTFLNQHHIETRPIIAGNMSKHPGMQLYQHRIAGSLTHCNTIMQQGFAIGCHHAIDSTARQYVCDIFDKFFHQLQLS